MTVQRAGLRLGLDWTLAARSIPHGRGQGVFLSEPAGVSDSLIRNPSDKQRKVLPVISVFDHSPP